jgi:stage II sporulation protein D
VKDAPGFRVVGPRGFGVVGSGFRVPEFRVLTLGVLAFGILATQNPLLATRNPLLTTQNLKNPQANPKNPLPATLNPEPFGIRLGRLDSRGQYVVETIPLENYVAQVVAGESLRGSQPAALEALAIAIRTFALANRTRHRSDGFDLCDQTHCQVLRTATAAAQRAADATAGRLLLRDGVPAQIFFSASCGGRTEIPSAVWPGAEDPPFLPSRPDDACQGAPAWTADLREDDLLRALRAAGFNGGKLADVRVASLTGSGRVARLQLSGLTPDHISGQDLRLAVGRTLGWQHIKSTVFELRRTGDTYRFTGHGSGHGVGLCVIGSARLAERGQSADAILNRYFPGLEIAGRRAPVVTTEAARAPSPVAVSLPDDDEGEHAAIERQALRARDDLARTLGVRAPIVTLRFHATTREFEQATGQPWFVSSAAAHSELHLVPVAALRDRGVLDQTIRRGLVRMMVDEPLRDRPQWVRDGAALFFADPSGGGVVAGRATCPTDSELRAPVSAGALGNAYARARACFARQIASGRHWRDVR